MSAVDIHSCGPTCSRQACVQAREVEEMRATLNRCRKIQKSTAEGWRHEVAEIAGIVGAPAHTAELAEFVRGVVNERNAARAEVARLTAQLEIITAENHSRAMREARSLEDWASLRAEAERMRNALRKLLLSRDASWTGGHDWKEAIDDAVKALGMEVDE